MLDSAAAIPWKDRSATENDGELSRGSSSGGLLGVDVGGTFTDAVLISNGRLFTAKTPSTDPQSAGVMMAARAVMAAAELVPSDVTRFVHGMTVATNALLEGKGARVVVVTTEGFRDLLAIGRQDRSQLYTLYPHRPDPLVPRERCLTVKERVGPEGVEIPLRQAETEGVCRAVAGLEPESVAVCLLWSFLSPEHEVTVREALKGTLPGVHVVTSSELAPAFREYERLSTTVVDAYVTPRTKGYLQMLAAACVEAGLILPEIMQSSGGTAPLTAAGDHGSHLLLSGPAGGAVAARLLGEQMGFRNVLSFDMGGTSTDCAALRPGARAAADTSTERTVAGLPVRLPMADIHTVSAGGGSIASFDEGGALKVGPQSAGAEPGPACYGLGGTEATVTDANVVLGRIHRGSAFGGSLVLDVNLATAAVGRLAAAAGLGLHETAEGIVRVAVFNMAAALRKVTLERGVDPRDFVLVAFGGAGGLHACELAEEIGVTCILVPVQAGVFSALGLVASPLRADASSTVMWLPGKIGPEEWHGAWDALEGRVRGELTGTGVVGHADRGMRAGGGGAGGPLFSEPVLRREVEVRYEGQSHELTVVLQAKDGPGELELLFHALHEERYGYREPESEVEVVTIRAVGFLLPARPLPEARNPSLLSAGQTLVTEKGRQTECSVLEVGVEPDSPDSGQGTAPRRVAHCGHSEPGLPFPGPAVLSALEFSAYLAPGWELTTAHGALVFRRRPLAAESAESAESKDYRPPVGRRAG